MKAYKYDNDGYFAGSIFVQKDKKSGNYLLPKNTTLLEPTFESGKRAKFVDGQWTNEDIDYEALANAANAKALARQANKSTVLKETENAYLTLVSSIPGVEPGDNSDTITQKLETSEELTDVQKVMLGLKLLNAVHEIELKGGSWYDLPSSLHVIEE